MRLDSRPLRAVGAAIALLTLAGLPLVLPSDWATIAVIAAEFALAVAGLVLLNGYAGQLSLGQSGFMMVGGYASALFTVKLHWDPLPALLVGLAASMAIAAVLGFVMLRLRGLYLALGTLAFVLIVESLANAWNSLTGGSNGVVVGPFGIGGLVFDSLPSQFYLSVALLAVTIVASRRFLLTSRGLAVAAIGRDELSAASVGIPVSRYKVAIFVASAAMASVAGSLYVHTLSVIAPSELGTTQSLHLIAMNFLGGVDSFAGAIVGALVLQALPYLFGQAQQHEALLDGVVLTGVLLLLPGGLAPGALGLARRRLRLGGDGARWQPPATVAGHRPHRRQALPMPTGSMLAFRDISKRFGGAQALVGVNVAVSQGTITSVVGPNGAGKTTLLNIGSGIVRPDAGSVLLCGVELTRLAPDRIAAAGLARTFQTPRLSPRLTVLENTLIGTFLLSSVPLASIALGLPGARCEHSALRERTLVALQAVGLEARAGELAGSLPLGLQRRLEIARCLVASPRLLLLDEPAAGFNDSERRQLADLLMDIRAAGATVLLVEHNMDLVMTVSDCVFVLDHGVVIASGPPHDVRHDPAVIDAYLGHRASEAEPRHQGDSPAHG